MKHISLLILIFALFSPEVYAQQKTTREERTHVNEGNVLFNKGDYEGAKKEYEAALKINGGNLTARYNYALSRIRLAAAKDKPENAGQLFKDAMSDLSSVVSASAQNPSLAAKAAYNMGNIAYNQQDYSGAVSHYKDALRLDPEHEKSRRNLRIAQKKLQQNQNQNNNNNDKNNNQNNDQDKNQNKNEDKNKDNKDENKDKDKQDKQDKIDQQNADRILNAVENKENATRARMQGSKGNKNDRTIRPVKNW